MVAVYCAVLMRCEFTSRHTFDVGKKAGCDFGRSLGFVARLEYSVASASAHTLS